MMGEKFVEETDKLRNENEQHKTITKQINIDKDHLIKELEALVHEEKMKVARLSVQVDDKDTKYLDLQKQLQYVEATRGAEMLKLENRLVTVKDNLQASHADNSNLTQKILDMQIQMDKNTITYANSID